MYLVHDCICCKSNNVRFDPAYLAQFVVWRSTGKPFYQNRLISSAKCLDCGWLGSSVRLDKEEITRLYKDYRGDEYNKLRIQLEPYYADLVDNFTSQKEIDRRMVGINVLIDKHINVDLISSVLDYGGGTGHFIPSKFTNAKKYVYDISDAPLCEGVERFDITENRPFDFVMCCHVLEHESDPDDLMKELFKFSHSNTLFYFEVPNYDAPPVPNGIFHEHQSIFNVNSLSAFLRRHRLNIIDIVQYSENVGYNTMNIGFLAHKTNIE